MSKSRLLLSALVLGILSSVTTFFFDWDKNPMPQGNNSMGQGVVLAAPSVQDMFAFPSDEAGFSMYVDAASLIKSKEDLIKASAICEFPTIEFTETHLLCVVSRYQTGIRYEVASREAHAVVPALLYADVNGRIVTYFRKNIVVQTSAFSWATLTIPVSVSAAWSVDDKAPIFDSSTGLLDELIKKTVVALGGDYETLKPSVGYYHWNFPEATVLTVIVKTTLDTDIGSSFNFSIPETIELFETSMTAFGMAGNQVLLNDKQFLRATATSHGDAHLGARLGSPVATGVLHKVQNEPQLGSALYLLWRE